VRTKQGSCSDSITQRLVFAREGTPSQLQIQGSPATFLQRSSRSTTGPLSSKLVSHEQILSQGKFYNCRKLRLKPDCERSVHTPDPAPSVRGAWVLSSKFTPALITFHQLPGLQQMLHTGLWLPRIIFLSFISGARASAIPSSFLFLIVPQLSSSQDFSLLLAFSSCLALSLGIFLPTMQAHFFPGGTNFPSPCCVQLMSYIYFQHGA